MPPGLQIKVAICDDHPVVRSGFAALISSHSDFVVVAQVATGRQAQEVARSGECDVLLLDLSMPDQSGIDTLRSITQRDNEFKVLILSGYSEKQYALNVLKLGAKGYLSKDCEPQELIKALRIVASGRRYVSQEVADMLACGLTSTEGAEAPHLQLSDRELQIFLHLARGAAVGKIATMLNLSPKTVSTYRARVMERMNLDSNSALTHYALQQGLID